MSALRLLACGASFVAACWYDVPDLAGDAGDGSGGDAPFEAGGDAPANLVCPSTGKGPPMILVTDPHGAFCIDSLEVSGNDYVAMPPVTSFSDVCSWKTTTSTGAAVASPVSGIDWCDARAYCEWAGKRLCGSRDGKPLDVLSNDDDPASSEWYAACSKNGANVYPYGNTYQPKTCNGCDQIGACDSGASSTGVSGSFPNCVGGYGGIFDMSGNIAEFSDDCATSGTPMTDLCLARGGDGRSVASDLVCSASAATFAVSRQTRNPHTGVRCCATPTSN